MRYSRQASGKPWKIITTLTIVVIGTLLVLPLLLPSNASHARHVKTSRRGLSDIPWALVHWPLATTTTTTTTAPTQIVSQPSSTTTTTIPSVPATPEPAVMSGSPGNASADPYPGAWDALPGAVQDGFACIRQHESGDDYSTNTGNGYYGAYQFLESTWLGIGESGYPSDAAQSVQDDGAAHLYDLDGWSQWGTAGLCGL